MRRSVCDTWRVHAGYLCQQRLLRAWDIHQLCIQAAFANSSLTCQQVLGDVCLADDLYNLVVPVEHRNAMAYTCEVRVPVLHLTFLRSGCKNDE